MGKRFQWGEMRCEVPWDGIRHGSPCVGPRSSLFPRMEHTASTPAPDALPPVIQILA